MIGCLLFGTFVAVSAARLIHRRHGCGGPFGGHGYGGWGSGGPPWHSLRAAFYRHHHGHGGSRWGGPGFGTGMERGEYGFPPHVGAGGGEGFDHDERFWNEDDDRPRRRARGVADSITGYIARHLRATATQEGVIRGAVNEFVDQIKEAAGEERKKSRQDLGAVLRKPHFDEVFMGELFARQDTAIERSRKALVGLMARVHDVLDEEQRGRLADLVEKGPRLWGRGFGW